MRKFALVCLLASLFCGCERASEKDRIEYLIRSGSPEPVIESLNREATVVEIRDNLPRTNMVFTIIRLTNGEICALPVREKLKPGQKVKLVEINYQWTPTARHKYFVAIPQE